MKHECLDFSYSATNKPKYNHSWTHTVNDVMLYTTAICTIIHGWYSCIFFFFLNRARRQVQNKSFYIKDFPWKHYNDRELVNNQRKCVRSIIIVMFASLWEFGQLVSAPNNVCEPTAQCWWNHQVFFSQHQAFWWLPVRGKTKQT